MNQSRNPHGSLWSYSVTRVLAFSALVASGLFVFLMAIGAIVIPDPWLAVLLSVLAVWLLPGVLLWGALLRRHTLGMDSLPLFLLLGLALFTLISALALLSGVNVEFVLYVVAGLDLLFLVVCGVLISRPLTKTRSPPRAQGAMEPSVNYVLLGALLILLLVLVLVFTMSATVVKVGDRWTYLGLVRNHLDAPQLATSSPFLQGIPVIWRQALDTWGLQLALLSKIAHVDPVDLYSFYLPPILMVASALAYVGFAAQVYRSWNLALFAFLFQVLYLFSAIQSDEGMGFHFFARMVEDKFVTLFVLYPLAMLFMLRYVSTGRLRSLLGFGLAVCASGLVHPIGPVHCALATGGFALAHLPFNWRREKLARFLALALLVVLALLPPFFQRAQVSKFSLTSSAFTEQSLAQAMSDYSDRLLILDLDREIYMAHPHLIEHPLIILALLLTPLLLLDIEHSITSQFLFSNMAFAVALLYNPLSAPLLGKLITPWMVERLSWILPTTLIVSLFIYKALSWIYTKFAKRTPAEHSYTWGLLLLLPVVLAVILFWGRLAGSWDYLQWWYSRSVSPEERVLMQYMREHTRTGSVILAWPEMSNHIPGLMGKAYPIMFRTLEASPASAQDDIRRFYAKEQVDVGLLDILERHSVDYVVLATGTSLAFQFDQLPTLFSRVYRGEMHEIFEVNSELKENCVVQGNTLIHLGDWEQAVAAYECALEERIGETLAYWGLVKAYKAQGRIEEMIAAAQQLDAQTTNMHLVHDYLADELDIEPSYLLSYLAAPETFQMPVDANVTHNLLEQLDSASHSPPDNPEYIRRSVFVIDRIPRGVVFQHAPSSITYQLTVPEDAVLSYALALAPAVWSFGKGDGTQFDVELQDAAGSVHHLFSEYIDPKNVLEHRQWHAREIDLSAWSDQTVHLTFYTRPGPNGDNRYDWAGWAEPRITQSSSHMGSPSNGQ